MTKLLNRWLPGATLTTWSAILLYFYMSGRIQAFLAPSFRPYVLVGGIVLGLMALITLFRSEDPSCCATDNCGHPLSRGPIGKLLTFLVLVLPITLTAMVSTDSFGKSAIENRGIDMDGSSLRSRKNSAFVPPEMPLPTKDESAAAPISATPAPSAAASKASPTDYLQRTPEGYIVAEVLDLLYAAQDDALRPDFEGKKVELIGQLMPDKSINAKGLKRFKAVRMFMSCCAADARPVATLVEVASLPELPEMTWVKVIGIPTFPFENGRRTAVLQAELVRKAEPPEENMLY